jgi:tetratricopeptide (TPR) repeat protein
MNVEEFSKLARVADDNGHSASAFELFKRIVDLEPGKDSAIFRATINLLEIGRISEAERVLNTIRRNAAPKPGLIEYALGKLRLAQFRPKEAEQHFRNYLKLAPDSTAPAVLLADCLRRQEKFDEASRVLLAALNAKGDLDEVYLNLGLVKRATGDYKSAHTYLIKALEITPEYTDAKFVLADVEFWLELGIS